MTSESDSGNNLLVGLHRWAAHQDENFLTEALVHLLRHLVAEEAESALKLLAITTGDRLILDADDLTKVVVSTQSIIELGRPDIEIHTPDHLIYIEAKVESGMGDLQLLRYRNALAAAPHKYTTLVLLSRYAVSESEVSAIPDAWLRWFMIGDFLQDQLEYEMLETSISRYLARQMVGFLHWRGIIMDRICWEMPAGVRGLISLLDLVSEVISSLGYNPGRSVAWTWIGFKFGDNRSFWTGIRNSEPHLLCFTTEQIHVDPELWNGLGEVIVAGHTPSGYQWQNKLNLESEAVHFFSRSRGSQQNVIEEFLQSSLDFVMPIIKARKKDITETTENQVTEK